MLLYCYCQLQSYHATKANTNVMMQSFTGNQRISHAWIIAPEPLDATEKTIAAAVTPPEKESRLMNNSLLLTFPIVWIHR